jgi:hypothetical protein
MSERLAGVAKAGMAWASWREGHTEQVLRLAADALEHWGTPTSSFYYKGLCLWPLMSLHLAAGRLGEAVDTGRQMLERTQVRLPDDLEVLVNAAEVSWGRDDASMATVKLSEALRLACELGFA